MISFNEFSTSIFFQNEIFCLHRTAVMSSTMPTSSKDHATLAENEMRKKPHQSRSKFSIQKFIRHGLSSWRKRRKGSSSSSPAPITSAPNSPPSSSIGRSGKLSSDLSRTLPVEPIRSFSLDLPSHAETPHRQISIELDPSGPTDRLFIPSPWTPSSAIPNPPAIESTTIHSGKFLCFHSLTLVDVLSLASHRNEQNGWNPSTIFQ